MIVVIDDERTFKWDVNEGHPPVYFRNSNNALAFLANWWTEQFNNCPPTYIEALYLDHDLGGGDTTIPVVKFLAALSQVEGNDLEFLGNVFIHSQNPVGARNLKAWCHKFSPNVSIIPLPELVWDD